ncbi:hypothetical protein [Flavilitoribacter nigricans]|uniref:Uncharacterized protein n=1 Tax=Flavilitoribacter nigricans (strain ATCC 23147 / DSM 23189 / NBRC 102662 / NCIMB 1420 / SS-2) TaxID=1122177 RepID=A0A2D0NJX0_FLAN2|nr:hypothetical protein [Flavilitoribacter nigricans]PHN08033.1 hypothetical protein CRP01_03185 [Flavilitoribacter nigricans DSM 23189 = NBRC 102662]
MDRHLLYLFAGCLFLFISCNQFNELEEITKVDYQAEYAIPIVNTNIALEDLLEKLDDRTTLVVDPDGLIRLQYSGDVLRQTSADVFANINQTIASVPLIPITEKHQALPFSSPDGLQMDRLDLKAGEFYYTAQNDHPFPVKFSISSQQVTKNGVPMEFSGTIQAYSGSGDKPFFTNLFTPASLKDYKIIPTDDVVYIDYEALDPDGNPVDLSTVFIRIQDLDFYYVEGYLGNQIYEGGRDTIIIDFFDSWTQGDVYFEEPKITVNVENSFGIPTRSVFEVFNVFTVRNEILPIQSTLIDEGIDFPYPTLSEKGQVKEGNFVFTKENSNIDLVLGSGPIAVDYEVNALTNPDQLTEIRGFITDSSYYNVRLDVDLPLYGQASSFIARDTFELDFSTFGKVSAAEFKMVTDNGLPLSVDIQGYFMNEKGIIIDSLLQTQERVIAAAPVNAEGEVTSPSQEVKYIDIPEDRFKNLQSAKRLLLIAAFSTVNDGSVSVKVLKDQSTDIRMGAILKVKNE